MSFHDTNIDRADYFYQLGRKDERERIVKLLETDFAEGSEHLCEDCDTFLLIKGEQK